MAVPLSSPSMRKVEELMQDDPEKVGLGLVAAVDRVLEELQKNGMAWRMRIRPCQVGVDPSNRDGVGARSQRPTCVGAP